MSASELAIGYWTLFFDLRLFKNAYKKGGKLIEEQTKSFVDCLERKQNKNRGKKINKSLDEELFAKDEKCAQKHYVQQQGKTEKKIEQKKKVWFLIRSAAGLHCSSRSYSFPASRGGH